MNTVVLFSMVLLAVMMVVSNGAPQGTNYGSSRQVDGQVSGQGGFGYSMSAGASGTGQTGTQGTGSSSTGSSSGSSSSSLVKRDLGTARRQSASCNRGQGPPPPPANFTSSG